jgi:hypothetical protein
MRRAAILIFGLLLTACGGAPPVATSTTTIAPAASNVAQPEPGTIDDLIAYGRRHSGEFGGLYVDPPGSTSAVMLFTANLEMHRDAVSRILPGTRVREVAHTQAELEALMESLDLAGISSEDVQPISAALDVSGNRVTLEVKTNDPTFELELELAHGGMLDVTVFPIPGPWANVESGDGWRLLATGVASNTEAYTVRAAVDMASWTNVWDAIGLEEERPVVDIADEVVVTFGHGIGSSCSEIRLDGVAIDGGVVYSQTSDPLAPRACTSDLAAAVVFVVALEREALPDGGFTLQLGRDLVTCADCGFTEQIDVPLP